MPKYIKFITFTAAIILTPKIFLMLQAEASSPMELTCRSQAKELAVQTYQNCVTEARTQRIKEIRKEYQTKLTELKSTYDQELKSLAGADSQNEMLSSDEANERLEKSKKDKMVAKARSKYKKAKSRVRAATGRLPEKLTPTKSLPMQPGDQAGSEGFDESAVVTPEPTDSSLDSYQSTPLPETTEAN